MSGQMRDNSRTKTGKIELRITEAEKAVLRAAAEADRRSLSDWARLTLLDAAAEQQAGARKKPGK